MTDDLNPGEGANRLPIPTARPEPEGEWQAPPRLEWRVHGPDGDERPTAAPRREWRRLAAAASLATVVAIGGAAAAVHMRQAARAELAETHALAHRLDALTAKIDSLETGRIRDELASQRKLIAEIKAGAANARDAGGAVTQLASRMDRLEKDQSARLDKLAERMDHDSATRVADLTSRLDKLEAKAAAPAVAVLAPTPPAKPEAAKVAAAPTPPAKPEATKIAPAVSYETTGSIEKPRQRLHGYHVAEIHNGYAIIDGPDGEYEVGPGDRAPDGGRVLRIERHGRDWVVVTTAGEIAALSE
jgi:cell division septation protein DedD